MWVGGGAICLLCIRRTVFGGMFPTENHHDCCEKLWFVRSIDPNLPQMGQNLYHDMLMPLHDSMPSFMNFRRVLDLLEFKNQVSQCLRPSDGRVFEIQDKVELRFEEFAYSLSANALFRFSIKRRP